MAICEKLRVLKQVDYLIKKRNMFLNFSKLVYVSN